ncbi:MAG: fructosamine kinase family protein [Bacteroidota bacterium]
MDPLIAQISEENHLGLTDVTPLSGGDINRVFLLSSPSQKYVVKINHAKRFPGLFTAEAKGLSLLARSESFQIPKVIASGIIQDFSYLLLEHIEEGNPRPGFWEDFAQNLAALHQHTADEFGLDHDNYIGSLPQYNHRVARGDEFYITQRLEPQFKKAREQGYSFTNITSFYKVLSGILPNEPPALIHGDLWNGNYLVSSTHVATLIDPAVAYAPREMDLGMMQLFGGFPTEVFERYHEIFPLAKGWTERRPLWQLYYILVHLNLFGAGYYDQVQRILKQYS